MSVHVLAELGIGDLDRFLAVFATEGHDKRWEHGCEGADVFTPVGRNGTVLVLLEFRDLESFESFRDDPTAPPIMEKGGAPGAPVFTGRGRPPPLPPGRGGPPPSPAGAGVESFSRRARRRAARWAFP